MFSLFQDNGLYWFLMPINKESLVLNCVSTLPKNLLNKNNKGNAMFAPVNYISPGSQLSQMDFYYEVKWMESNNGS